MRLGYSVILGAALLLGCGLAGCGQSRSDAAASEPSASDAASDNLPIIERAEVLESDDEVVRFSDILAQYQQLNTRLEDVAARLQIANAPLCQVTVRDAGYTVHTLSDYPAQLQQVAKGLLSVDEKLSVRTVRAGSSAQLAGVQPGDRLIGVNGQRFPSGVTQMQFYSRASEAAFDAPTARLTIARHEGTASPELLSFKLTPDTICGYPAHVVFDEHVNGHTDGRAVWITSELMRTVEDDVNLALIVAHEMAHAMAGHVELSPTDEARKILELTADSMGLVMLARAGFDIDRAISYWTRADNPQRLSQSRSQTHPSITQRLDNFEAARRAIVEAQRRGGALDFSILPEPVL